MLLTALAVAAGPAGCDDSPSPPQPTPMLRGDYRDVEPRLRPLVERIASRVEAIRGLRFRLVPEVRPIGLERLETLGAHLARRARRHIEGSFAELRVIRRLRRASIGFDQLAGLLPPELTFGPDAAGALDRIGGAYDYRHGRILLLPDVIVTRDQLHYTLAHELTHALEDQRFHLHLAGLIAPGETTAVRRAVVEGTATFVQDRYRRRYLEDQVPIARRLEGMRSVIGAGPGAYAVNAQAVFDYVDGGLFVENLQRRGGWRLVARAIRHPPRTSLQVLHPRRWPQPLTAEPVRLGVAGILGQAWHKVGGGVAGEQQALVILLAGTIRGEALIGAGGWQGGRFALWRPKAGGPQCVARCAKGDVGVVAFRWRQTSDVEQFEIAVPPYMILGRLAVRIDDQTWQVGDGFAALGSAHRGSALVFAPSAQLAQRLARRAAITASRG